MKETIIYILILALALMLLHLGLKSCEMSEEMEEGYYTKQAYAQEAVRTAHLFVK